MQIIIALPKHTISYQVSILCDSVHTMDELSPIIIFVLRSGLAIGAALAKDVSGVKSGKNAMQVK